MKPAWRAIAAPCASSPAICLRIWPMRSLSCATCPARDSRRAANSRAWPSTTAATAGSVFARAASAGSQATVPASPNSASRRLRHATNSACSASSNAASDCSFPPLRRTSTWPASTRSPSFARIAPTVPPSKCSTTWSRVSTSTWPAAITAPEIEAKTPQPNSPPPSTASVAKPSNSGRRVANTGTASSIASAVTNRLPRQPRRCRSCRCRPAPRHRVRAAARP